MRLLIVVLLTLSSCGSSGVNFPIRLEGGSAVLSKIVPAIYDLEVTAGKQVLSANGKRVVVTPMAETHSPEGYLILGTASPMLNECQIQIYDEYLNNPQLAGTLKTVVWHELGHCVGMDHVEEPRHIMSEHVFTFTNYSPEALNQFVSDFLRAIRS